MISPPDLTFLSACSFGSGLGVSESGAAPTGFYGELKGWQTAIGSVLGFIALVAGALFNFYLNRRRDASLRKDEARSIAAALYGEILLLRREAALFAIAVANVYRHVGTSPRPIMKFDHHFIEAHPLSEPLLYRALADKIGLLDADLIISVTQFHQHFQEMRLRLPLLVEKEDRGYTYSPGSVLAPARDAVVKVVPALRKIEKMASICTPAEEALDMGHALDVIEEEDELSRE
jgi:hypothetical protein